MGKCLFNSCAIAIAHEIPPDSVLRDGGSFVSLIPLLHVLFMKFHNLIDLPWSSLNLLVKNRFLANHTVIGGADGEPKISPEGGHLVSPRCGEISSLVLASTWPYHRTKLGASILLKRMRTLLEGFCFSCLNSGIIWMKESVAFT